MSLSQVVSGFDLELVFGEVVVEHLFQLFMDTGDLDSRITLAGGQNAILISNSDVRRTYGPSPKFAYFPNPTEEPFGFRVHDMGTFEPAYAWFSVTFRVVLADTPSSVDLYFRVLKDIDVRAEIDALLAYIDDADGRIPPYDILRLFRLEAVLNAATPFDTRNPEANVADAWVPFIADINSLLTGLVEDMKAGTQPEALAFLRSQADPLTMGALERIGIQPYPGSNHFGICLNLHLLEHDSGWLGKRGNPAAARDFLPAESDFAVGTSPDFASHMVDDCVIKYLVRAGVDSEELTRKEGLAILDGRHFPLDVPRELLMSDKQKEKWEEKQKEDPEKELGKGALRVQVLDTAVDTVTYTFQDSEGVKTKADSLKVTVKTGEGLFGSGFGVTEENLVIFLTPLESVSEGLPVTDIGIDSNLRVDLLRSLAAPFLNPLGILEATLGMVGASFYNLFTNDGDRYAAAKASELGFDLLSRLHLKDCRWDPFYTTRHGFLLERQQFRFEADRAFAAGMVHLSKVREPFAGVYVRDADCHAGGAVLRLRYRVEDADAIVAANFFATDREDFRSEETDREDSIFSLAYDDRTGQGHVSARLDAGKLARCLPYSPYALTKDSHEGHRHIDRIWMLSWLERKRIENRLLNDWLGFQIDLTIKRMLAEGAEFTPEELEALRKEIIVLFQDSGRIKRYQENRLPKELQKAIYSEGTLRLALSPFNLDQLQSANVLLFPGYAKVVRKGHLYFRDKADSSTEDNLLSLPDA